ncbi:hypothetical protein P280DRAFT_531385 [Massarina eburnea CBS 473.64]|uniref:NACHT domain-containing protein n=1 Tax=Massarina eburnea CBS 473.64 TaxID=1395130 RepID=A0A6A6SBX1_9PLEO|nr:hypothetical protein P280DRAFT_531385 [Massarina eburnea CBS 473.64]
MSSAPWTDATHVFEHVIQDFRASLSPTEKTLFMEFGTSKDMIKDLQQACEGARNGRKLSRLCHRIDRFASAWEPFFDITGIFVQTHPEFAGFAWGAIRLVFLLGSNYVTHLERLVAMLQRIAELLPAYEEYFKLFVNRHKTNNNQTTTFVPQLRHHRLYKALAYVYADIIQFCQEACKIFGTKRGESKYLEQQNEKLDISLQQIQDQIEDLREANEKLDSKISGQLQAFECAIENLRKDVLTRQEIQEKEKEALSMFKSWPKSIADAFRDAKLPSMKSWINAPEYMREHEKALRRRLPDTFVEKFRLRKLEVANKPNCVKYSNSPATQDTFPERFCAQRDVIDRVAVLIDSESSGQAIASDDEVLASLSLLLQSITDSVLVFDGIDECEDPSAFLEALRDMSSESQTQILLLARPNVEMPAYLSHLVLDFDSHSNMADIKRYLQPQIMLLQDRRLISDKNDIQKIVDVLASRAEGMFLWAWLFTQYLNCRALTPQDRMDAIFVSSLIEGLDDVYRKIISVLGHYRKEKDRIQRIFEFIAVATRPLEVSELEIAVAIIPGKITAPSEIITDFETSLPIICGALVEVQSNSTVRFIHSSFRDFLTNMREGKGNELFAVNERRAHASASLACLSYILHDLPSSSICKAIGGNNISMSKSSFPFLSYALEWVKHAGYAFIRAAKEDDFSQNVQDDFDFLVTRFINRPLSITAWIEASWICGTKPSLAVLVKDGSEVHSADHVSLHVTRDLAFTLIEELSNEIEQLNAEWSHLLEKDPFAIWGTSITAFSRSSFWYQTKATVVSSMLPAEAAGPHQKSHEHRPLLVKSQVSFDGNELGIVMIIPSRGYLRAAETIYNNRDLRLDRPIIIPDQDKRRLAAACASGWQIRYQRRDIRSEAILMDFTVDFPEPQISDILIQGLSSKTPHRFPFPVSLSRDLNRLIALRSILIVRKDNVKGSETPTAICKIQCLDRPLVSQTTGKSATEMAFHSEFSPDESSLALVFGDVKPGAIDYRKIQVWSDATVNNEWPHFECNGEVTSSRLSHEKEIGRRVFTFHPYLPLLAYSSWNFVAFWRYKEKFRSGHTFLKEAVTSLQFSHDGTCLVYETMSCRNSDDRTLPPPPKDTGVYSVYDKIASRPLPGTSICESKKQLGPEIIRELTELPKSKMENSLDSSATVTAEGAVVSGSSLLAHLPRLQRGDQTHISLLPTAENDEWMRLVWNKDMQESYSIFDHQSAHVPSIIYRKRGTTETIRDASQDAKRTRIE